MKYPFFKSFGPAWIVMIADVDVASIVTGIQSGVSFGYHLIFIEIILTVPLAVIQYVSGTVAIHTGKGIAENIRTGWGKQYAYASALPMAVTDFLSYAAEYSGIAIGFELLGMSPVLGILLAFIFHNMVILSRRFERVEFPLILISFVLVATFAVIAFASRPDPSLIVSHGLTPIQPYGNHSYLYLAVANIGAVVMPWMIFYQAGANVEKSVRSDHSRVHRLETIIGALVSELIMCAIIVAAAGLSIRDGSSVEGILAAFGTLGSGYQVLMAIGFISAGFLALVVISLSSAWGVCEAAGIKFRFSSRISERKGFYLIFLLESFPAMLLSLYSSSDLITLLISLMVIYVVVDIPVLTMVGLIARRNRIVEKGLLSRTTISLYWIFFMAIELTGFYSISVNGIQL